MPLDQQSVLPTVRGVPWWGAVLVATAITGIGAAIDASNTDGLGGVFKFCYLVGCVTAALAVRRRALFTAAAQPPLIAFLVGVITLYGLNADQASSGAKSLIFQVLLPIANDFPWMALTFFVTLGLVVARWYLTRDPSGGDKKRPGGPARASAANGAKKKKKKKTATRAPDETRKKPAKSSTDAAAAKSGGPKTGTPGSDRSRAPQPGESHPRTSRTDGSARPEKPGAGRSARPKKPGARPADSAGDGAADRTDSPARAEKASRAAGATARAASNGTAHGRRSTAGAVFRAGAGEQIDAAEDVHAPPASDRRVAPLAEERPRYESATHRASTAQYQSTRTRNRA
ncbi:hypothetical protein GIY30_05285 [Gordonia sp. HNM0687]|uniref:DUF6542 domain-containing protein n=1 Tax=Gordonia mangrovi TaxID=2665643 RepID=A0A6L7GLK0_9ACTN|nr:hypothetical protein [Gordonia mangrovi]